MLRGRRVLHGQRNNLCDDETSRRARVKCTRKKLASAVFRNQNTITLLPLSSRFLERTNTSKRTTSGQRLSSSESSKACSLCALQSRSTNLCPKILLCFSENMCLMCGSFSRDPMQCDVQSYVALRSRAALPSPAACAVCFQLL